MEYNSSSTYNNSANHSCGGVYNDPAAPFTWINLQCNKKFFKPVFVCENTINNANPDADIKPNRFYCPIGFVNMKEQCIRLLHRNKASRCRDNQMAKPFSQLEHYLTSWRKSTEVKDVILKQKNACNCLIGSNLKFTDVGNWRTERCMCSTSTVLCQIDVIRTKHICPTFSFKCENGNCILAHYECNGVKDCADGSDEEACTLVCDSENCFSSCSKPKCRCTQLFYQCSSGGCIPFSHLCDGISHCPYNEDELTCPSQKTTALKPNKCRDKGCQDIQACRNNWCRCAFLGSNKSCFPNSHICVFERDIYGNALYCDNTEHLRFCFNHSCPQMFKCRHTYCIPLYHICDGVADCPDESDELICSKLVCSGYFKCSEGTTCVSLLNVCDGIVHCKLSKDDETFCHQIINCPKNCICRTYLISCSGYLDSLTIFRDVTIILLDKVSLPSGKVLFSKNAIMLSMTRCNITFSQLQLRHLKYIFITQNGKVKNFNMARMPRLMAIYLHKTIVPIIQSFSFSGLLSMKELNLSFVGLIKLQGKSFINIDNINNILLNDNSLKTLPVGIFTYVKKLTNIDLRNNFLEGISADAFNVIPFTIQTDHCELCCNLFMYNNCLPLLTKKQSAIICQNIVKHDYTKYIAYCVLLVCFFLNVVILNLKVKHINQVQIQVLYFNLIISNCLPLIGISCVHIYNVFYFDKFQLLQSYWKDSLQCYISGCLIYISIHNSSLTHTLITYNTWLLVTYPLERRGITCQFSYMMMTYMWCIVSVAIISLKRYTNMSVTCTGFINHENFNTPLIIITCFVVLSKIIYLILLSYFSLSVVTLIKRNIEENISSSKKRTNRYLVLINSIKIAVICRFSDTSLYLSIFIFLLYTTNNTLHLTLFYALVFFNTFSETLLMYKMKKR